MPDPFISRRSFALACMIALTAASYGCASSRSRDPFTLVGMDEVQRMLSDPGVAIIDANTRETFVKNHLPGAKYWRSGPPAQVLPADRSARVVFYCASPA